MTFGRFWFPMTFDIFQNLVWCVDECHGVHAREAVYPELPVGLSWVSVSGISAVSIAVSRLTVWVLSPSGQIYRRTGISPTNWVGDAWECIPAPTGQVLTGIFRTTTGRPRFFLKHHIILVLEHGRIVKISRLSGRCHLCWSV